MYVVIIDLSQFEKKIVLYDVAVFQTSAHEKKRKKKQLSKSERAEIGQTYSVQTYRFKFLRI